MEDGRMNLMMMPNELMTTVVTTSTAMMRWQSYKENMNMDDDEHDRYDDGRQKHIYVTTQERNGCHLNTESHRITNYSSGDAASQQAGDIAN